MKHQITRAAIGGVLGGLYLCLAATAQAQSTEFGSDFDRAFAVRNYNQSSNGQLDWMEAERAPFHQEIYLETHLQVKLGDPRLQFPIKSEQADIGIIRKIGTGAAAVALVAMGYFSLLWLILQSCLFVFVQTNTTKKPASAK